MAVVDRKRKIVKPPANVGPSKARKLTKTPTKGPSSIRRNLKFDAFQSPRKTSKGQKTPKKNLPKSPMKTPSKKSLLKTPQKSSFATPKKVSKATPVKLETPKRKHVFTTPCKMTPGKVHRILAPETPTEKPGHRRKSDGTLFITESPDIDMIKQTKATPRRASASVALHKKTSFYSGNTSRSTARAEELIEASRLQSRLLQSESQDLNTSSRRTSDQNTSVLSNLLFSHLLKKTPAKEAEVNVKNAEIKVKSQRIEPVEPEITPPPLKKNEEEEDFMPKINRRLFEDAAKSLTSHSGTFRRTRRSSQLQEEAVASKGSPVKRCPLKPANLPCLDEVSMTFKSPSKKNCEEKNSPRRPKPLILDNVDLPSSRLEQGGIVETIQSPTLYERPSRRKSSTVRFGIDDIPLNEALHSPFGKNYRKFQVFSPSTTKNPPNIEIVPELESSNLSASEAESVPDSDTSFGSQIKNVSRSKPSSTRVTRVSRSSNDLNHHDSTNNVETFLEPPSKSPERLVVKVIIPKCYTEMVDSPRLGMSDQTKKRVLESPAAHLETSSMEKPQTPIKPHGNWAIIESVESPEGIKIKLNRRRCAKPAPPTSTRISRKQANELGIPLDKLVELITKTSPDKPFLAEKENAASNHSNGASNSENDDKRHLLKKLDSNTLTPGSRASIAEKSKFSPLTSKSLFDLTTSPIVDSRHNPNKAAATHERKPRKVNKRLYAEELPEPNKK